MDSFTSQLVGNAIVQVVSSKNCNVMALDVVEVKMKLQILIDVPPPAERTAEAPCRMSIEDKVRDALELIESGYESTVEWQMINKLYKALCKKKPNARIQNLKKMIEPVLAKYGLHGVSNEE